METPSLTTIPLTVKELADELGVSEHYVYQMHAAGFPMEWRTLPGCGRVKFLTATVESARDWIETHNFRLADGYGLAGGYQCQFQLQVPALKDARSVIQT